MGSALSHRNATAAAAPCWSCAGDVRPDVRHGLVYCKRCGALLASSSGLQDEEKSEELEERVDLHRVVISPLVETLPDDCRDKNEEFYMDKYIRPYFLQFPDKVLRIHEVIQICDIEWKLMALHPPSGVVNRHTKIRCHLPPLSALETLHQVNILPTQSTLREMEGQDVFETILRPYFADTERHLFFGQSFVVNNVQFKVMWMDKPSGRVMPDTVLLGNRSAVPDLERIHILPIFESLPNREKEITEQEVFERYLSPHFLGWNHVLTVGEEFSIDGVDFQVVAAEPRSGMVTLETTIFSHGNPLHYDDIRQQQMQDDEEMARRLQEEESGAFVIPLHAQHRASQEFQQRLRRFLESVPADNRLRPLFERLHDQLAANPARIGQMNFGAPQYLVELEGLFQDEAHSGIHQTQIEHLPTRRFSAEQSTNMGAEHKVCRVCLGDYEEGESLRTMPCFHTYHAECIDTWLRQNNKCPICKHPVA